MDLRTRLLVTLVSPMVLLVGLLTYGTFQEGRQYAFECLSGEASRVLLAKNGDLQAPFERSQRTMETVTTSITTSGRLDQHRLVQILKEAVTANPDIAEMSVEPDPGPTAISTNTVCVRRRVIDSVGTVPVVDITFGPDTKVGSEHSPKAGPARWSAPFFVRERKDTVLTIRSSPLIRDGKRIGSTTLTLSLTGFLKSLSSTRISKTGSIFVVSGTGKILAWPGMSPSESPVVDFPARPQSGIPTDVPPTIGKAGASFFEGVDPFTGRPSWIAVLPLEPLSGAVSMGPWSIVASESIDEALRPLTTLRNQVLLVSAGVLGLVFAFVFLSATVLISPIKKLVEQARRYTRGDYSQPMDERHGPQEMRELFGAFNAVGSAILSEIENVRVSTEQKERYRQELVIASKIQQDILPQKYPPFPDLAKAVDLYGLMKPATEIGGDLYDFVRLPGGDRIAIVVGDVVGKGAPAALFMATTRTLIRVFSEKGYPPSEILRRTNHALAAESHSGLFVTAVYAEYTPETGFVRVASAGHPQPLLVSPAGHVHELKLPCALPVGVAEGTRYAMSDWDVPEGWFLVLFSDGVTECMSSRLEEFGLEHLQEVIARAPKDSCQSLAGAILEATDQHSAGATQHDDITLVILQRLSGQVTVSSTLRYDPVRTIRVELPCDSAVFSTVGDLVATVVKEAGFDGRSVSQTIQALNEVVRNVISRSSESSFQERFSLELEPFASGLKIVVIDGGKPLDLNAARADSGHAYVSKETLEKMGFRLTRMAIDRVHYQPATLDGNRLTLTKYLRPTTT